MPCPIQGSNHFMSFFVCTKKKNFNTAYAFCYSFLFRHLYPVSWLTLAFNSSLYVNYLRYHYLCVEIKYKCIVRRKEQLILNCSQRRKKKSNWCSVESQNKRKLRIGGGKNVQRVMSWLVCLLAGNPGNGQKLNTTMSFHVTIGSVPPLSRHTDPLQQSEASRNSFPFYQTYSCCL